MATGAVAVGVGVAIFALTQQPPDVTTSQSSFVNDVMAAIFGEVGPHHDAAQGLWFGIGVRHWAHVVEFGALGLAVGATSVLLAQDRSLAKAGLAAVAICAACSLFDQCHKLFVPGRHFDVVDLAMDAAGYGLAIALVLLIAALTRRFSR